MLQGVARDLSDSSGLEGVFVLKVRLLPSSKSRRLLDREAILRVEGVIASAARAPQEKRASPR
jgi:hypothetical protein